MFSEWVVRSLRDNQHLRSSSQTKQICNNSRLFYEDYSSFSCLRLKTTKKAPLLLLLQWKNLLWVSVITWHQVAKGILCEKGLCASAQWTCEEHKCLLVLKIAETAMPLQHAIPGLLNPYCSAGMERQKPSAVAWSCISPEPASQCISAWLSWASWEAVFPGPILKMPGQDTAPTSMVWWPIFKRSNSQKILDD